MMNYYKATDKLNTWLQAVKTVVITLNERLNNTREEMKPTYNLISLLLRQ